MLKIVSAKNRRAVAALLAPERTRDAATERAVAKIVAAVRERGDAALLAYARRFDDLQQPIEVGVEEMRRAARTVPRDVRAAIRTASRNISAVANARCRADGAPRSPRASASSSASFRSTA
jgi:histidinol dehydrogenase